MERFVSTERESMAAAVAPGSVEQGLANGRRLLGSHPEFALEQAETLLRFGPDPRVYRLAAAALRRLGQSEEAVGAELSAIKVASRNKAFENVALAHADGRGADARAQLEQLLRAEPDDLLAKTMLAELALKERDFATAEKLLNEVLDRAPTFLRASMLLADSLRLQARAREAIALLETIRSKKPQNRTVLEQLAQLCSDVGEHDRAIDYSEQLLAVPGAQAEDWIIYAHRLRIVGRSSESRQALRRALALDPAKGAAWWTLANFFPDAIEPGDEAAIERALAQRGGSPQDGGPLHIALSILADRREEHERAFHHLAAGKELRKQMQPYDPDVLSAEVDHAIEVLTPSLLKEREEWGWQDMSPIFIIGMPRSGTTMVERILGQHSAVEPAGELRLIRLLMEILARRAHEAKGYAALMASMSADELAGLGRWYVERSRDYRNSDKPHFIDKLNLNWLHLGIIRTILPRAKIIDVRRSALDCCWSNYRMLFAEGHPPANDLRHIGRFYKDYVRMVDSISAAAPGAVLSVRYEDVVKDIEGQTRRMLEFCGLEFEPACIEFHRAKTAVATPSSEQVRRPINADAVGGAEPYRPWLGPLLEELGPLAN